MKRDSSELATSFAVLIVGKNLQKEERRDGTKKECIVCRRSIHNVGKRKLISKYCSSRCMFKARQIKRGDHFITIKIPIDCIPLLLRDSK